MNTNEVRHTLLTKQACKNWPTKKIKIWLEEQAPLS